MDNCKEKIDLLGLKGLTLTRLPAIRPSPCNLKSLTCLLTLISLYHDRLFALVQVLVVTDNVVF